ncbi:MAG: alpha-glucan family phosphorylase [Bacteroidia bacterium]|nr:alpha-glucan family phosphorylase [Bacteroidia bacterium]MDW8014470.1 alpha-glucan family phosphorylase [Bacteroidia bacterium]
MKDEPLPPSRVSLLFEVSWEVANKVGGIYTVLVGKAPLLYHQQDGTYWLIGPYLPGRNTEWEPIPALYADWREYFQREKGVTVHAGYWHIAKVTIPLLLIDFYPVLSKRNELFAQWWMRYGVDSLWGDWDYIEPAIFGYTAGEVIASFRSFYYGEVETIAHFHEWLTGAGILYLKENAPSVATLFTTHATVAGRASGGELIGSSDLQEWLKERRILSKHTLERAAWEQADANTTVSEIVSQEAAFYLGHGADVITPNGWDRPKDIPISQAREWLKALSEKWGWSEQPFWLLHSGRPELRNKGTLTLIEALRRYKAAPSLHKKLAVLFAMPADVTGVREVSPKPFWISHTLRFPEQNELFQHLKALALCPEDPIRIAYLPVYLEGNDGVFNLPYYALLGAVDATAFPSRYEPWGYTPQESLGVGVPTLSSRQAGFGRWMLDHVHPLPEALSLIDYEAADPPGQILDWLYRRLNTGVKEKSRLHTEALRLSERTRWSHFLPFYRQAYQVALTKAQARLWYRYTPPPPPTEKRTFIWHRAFFLPLLPEAIRPLTSLAYNLWWSWNPDAQHLFHFIYPEAWENSENPVWILNHTPNHRWEALSRDEEFLRLFGQVLHQFQSYMAQPLQSDKPKVAYLCMEYGLAKCLPFYSGGLGVLAGDYLKEASDNGYPLVAIGLLYRQGYFQQQISPEGEQISENAPLRFTDLPMEPVRTPDGRWLRLSLLLGEKPLLLKVWKVQVGRVSLYLLDADLSENLPELRTITARLYEGEPEKRLQQEIVLGFGAQALIEALGIEIDLFHYNEGHPAFHLLALWQRLRQQGLSLLAAQEEARLRTLFTTHTPVPAGHDAFPPELLRKYLAPIIADIGISWETFIESGKSPSQPDKFSLTSFCLRFAGRTNAVSQLHARISKKMFAPLYEGYLPAEIPIRGITNGVHIPTWQASQWSRSPHIWENHQHLRNALLAYLRRRLLSEPSPVAYLEAIQTFFSSLEETTLLIGFARRMATYKRHSLLVEQESMRKLIAEAPIKLILAGKAHPKDEEGKKMLKTLWQRSLEPPLLGKVLFVPDYDLQMARYLVQGVDVWLNLPIYGNEASGTSGMKAALNGVLHLSIPDGWWAEVDPNEAGGWSIPPCRTENPEIRDAWEATQLAYILKEEIIPLYRRRDARGIPSGWIARMEKARSYVLQRFSTQRMLKEYDEYLYTPAFAQLRRLDPETQKARLNLLELLQTQWNKVRIRSISLPPFSERAHPTQTPFSIELHADGEGIPPEALKAEVVFESATGTIYTFPLQHIQDGYFHGQVQISDAGVYHYAIRLYAWDPYLEERLWTWVKVV